jgi:2-(1,2-epoxy-1,2-dihydrophenyl)acetyl-CoA isomerase
MEAAMNTQTAWNSGTDDLTVQFEDGIVTLTMNRPERRNALSAAMLTAMAEMLDRCERDSRVACVVLTGNGGAFCAGGDVKGMADGTGGGSTAAAGADLDSRIHAQRISQRATAGKLYKMPKPTIAAIPGPAAGAGLSLALACDLRIAAETAVMTTAFAKVGFSGDYGGTYFLSQLVGSAKARELYYLSDRIDMREALRLGLVNWVVPADQLVAKTQEVAHRLAKGPRVAYRYMKENLNRAVSGADVDDCLDLEATHHVHTGFTEDHKEAAKAFVEKREPAFKGR